MLVQLWSLATQRQPRTLLDKDLEGYFFWGAAVLGRVAKESGFTNLKDSPSNAADEKKTKTKLKLKGEKNISRAADIRS